MSSAAGVIPARYASTRFPGKILADLCGRPLLHWVIEQAQKAERLDFVVVATDDRRIAAAAEEAGAEAVMTRADHPSGTDRIAEALTGKPVDIVINIQGDEPLMDPGLIDRAAGVLLDDPAWDMVTAATQFASLEAVADPSAVKAVFAEDGRALYFSRSVIPCVRDEADRQGGLVGEGGVYWRHLGLYGYRFEFLQNLVEAPPCATEQLEKLEQLRALHIGARMKVLQAAEQAMGVDTPEDLVIIKAEIVRRGLA